MPLAVSNRAALRYLQETNFGVIAASGPNTAIRFTGEGINFGINKDRSKEIRSDRSVADLFSVAADVNGPARFELSYREYDAWLEAVFQGTWGVYGTAGIGTAFSGTFTSTTITAGAAPTGSSAFTTLAKGQWFRLNAPAQPDDGKWFMVSRSVAPTSTVLTVDTLTPLAGTGSGIAGCTLATSRLTNGTTQRSFTIERQLLDVGQYFAYRGCVFNKLSLSFKAGAAVGGSFDVMGKDALRNTATNLPGGTTASQTYDVMNSVNNVGNIYEGGAALANTFVQSLDLMIDNNLRGQKAIGTLGNAGIASGTQVVTGKVQIYLADGTLYDKFINNTASSLTVRVADGSGNGYAVTLPKTRYTNVSIAAGSIDTDVMLSADVQAVVDPTTSQVIFLDRFGA
jgi:hypothetical protein